MSELSEKLLTKKYYPTIYMFGVMFVCSSILVGLSRVAEERINANAKIAFERAALQVLPGFNVSAMSNKEVHEVFMREIKAPDQFSGGAYYLRKNDEIAGYALPFEGRGFWAPIKGFIGISSDMRTVIGISFYEQNETPGLGAEIVKDRFRNQFNGRRFSESERAIVFRRAGEPLSENEVEAVTGATQTCTRLEKIINSTVNNWRRKMQEL